MTTLTLDAPCEFKFAQDSGIVEGYAAVFGNKDLGGDVLLPDAIKSYAKTRDGHVLLLYQHNPTAPIGKAKVAVDAHGLHFKAKLLDDALADRAHAHMKAGVLDGASIGYSVLPGGSKWKDDHRELSAIHVMEVSVVTWGMNPLARVETVKSAMDCASPRDLEHLLREAPHFQFSSRKAKKAAGLLWPLLSDRDDQQGERDVRAEEEALVQFAKSLNEITNVLKGK